ncbi:MAG: HD domain-containing phosphohydrolase [Deltaproteobacteria bacterium]
MDGKKAPFELKLSIQHESLLRKFTIVFFTLYFFPLAVLFFLIHNATIGSSPFLSEYGIEVDNGLVDRLFLFFLISSLVSFLWGRRIFSVFFKIARQAEDISRGNLGERMDVHGDKEIVELARSFNSITHRLEENIERLKMSKRMVLEVLYRISTGMADPAKSMKTFLRLILETTMNALDSYRGTLLLVGVEDPSLYVECSQGFSEEELTKKIAAGSEETLVVQNGRPIVIPGAAGKTETSVCVPLKHKEKTIGVFSLSGKVGEGDFSQDDIYLLANIATQTAVAIVNERLNLDAEQTYKQTVSALALAVEARDTYSRGHSDRVSRYAVMTARHIGLDPEVIQRIQDAAELHDVGKIGIEDEILRKPGPLTPDEARIMRKHPEIGESIVKPIHSLSNLCDLIRHHHEFLDGSGYPDGLKGEKIGAGVRILTIADAYDAMTSDRPYRKAKTHEEAVAELRKCAPSHYDEKLVDAFIAAFAKEGGGS